MGTELISFESIGLIGSTRHSVLSSAQKRLKKCLLNINLNQIE